MARAEPPLDRRARGDLVEAAAQAFLEARGLRLLARNAFARGGELDLVMLDNGGRDGECIVFVEVRYRASDAFGGAAASVDAGKRRKLIHAARLFLHRHPQYADSPCRFDVIDASGEPDAPRIQWLKDAFRADEP